VTVKHIQKVTLVTDLDCLMQETESEPMWMMRPQHHHRYATQRTMTTAELVDIETINLAQMKTFETV